MHFMTLFGSPVFYQVLLNTLIISGMKILFVFPIPIIVALLLNEIRGGALRKFIQSAIYLPHFLSWVVIAGALDGKMIDAPVLARRGPSSSRISKSCETFAVRSLAQKATRPLRTTPKP